MDRMTRVRLRPGAMLSVLLLTIAAMIAVTAAACGGTGTAAAGSPSPAGVATVADDQATTAAGTYNGRGIIAFTKVRKHAGSDWEEEGLYGVRSNGTGLFPLDVERQAISPARSADGREMVADSGGQLGYPGLRTFSADGLHQRTLTTPPTGQQDVSPAWAADGRVFFIRQDRRQSVGAICSVSADGSDLTQVAPVSGPASFALSPDGAWLVVWESCSDRIVRVLANGHGDEVVLVNGARQYGCLPVALSWSPDGRKIAFASASGGLWLEMPSALYVVNADGSRLRELPAAGTVFDPVWLPQSL